MLVVVILPPRGFGVLVEADMAWQHGGHNLALEWPSPFLLGATFRHKLIAFGPLRRRQVIKWHRVPLGSVSQIMI